MDIPSEYRKYFNSSAADQFRQRHKQPLSFDRRQVLQGDQQLRRELLRYMTPTQRVVHRTTMKYVVLLEQREHEKRRKSDLDRCKQLLDKLLK